MSISSQAFAGNLCCDKNLKNAKNDAAQSSNSKMPCHQVDKNLADNSTDQNGDNGKTSHANCCCDMGNCMSKIFFKTLSSDRFSLEVINFPTPLTNYKSQFVSLSEQPPKHSV